MEIIPAIIPRSLHDMTEKLSSVRGAAQTVQIDVTDGVFAGKPSWPHGDEVEFGRMMEETDGLPFWQDFSFEVDLMVEHADKRVEDFLRVGFSRAIFHFGAVDDMHTALSVAHRYDAEAGIALLPGESPEMLREYKGEFDFVQVMGIGSIGFQGAKFDERAVHTIQEVRAMFPDIIISVDGGVSERTAALLRDAGADRLVAGSAIFHTDDPKGAYAHLSEIVSL